MSTRVAKQKRPAATNGAPEKEEGNAMTAIPWSLFRRIEARLRLRHHFQDQWELVRAVNGYLADVARRDLGQPNSKAVPVAQVQFLGDVGEQLRELCKAEGLDMTAVIVDGVRQVVEAATEDADYLQSLRDDFKAAEEAAL